MEKLKTMWDIVVLICYLFAKTIYTVLLSCVIAFLSFACIFIIPFLTKENGYLVVIGRSDIIAGKNIFDKTSKEEQ